MIRHQMILQKNTSLRVMVEGLQKETEYFAVKEVRCKIGLTIDKDHSRNHRIGNVIFQLYSQVGEIFDFSIPMNIIATWEILNIIEDRISTDTVWSERVGMKIKMIFKFNPFSSPQSSRYSNFIHFSFIFLIVDLSVASYFSSWFWASRKLQRLRTCLFVCLCHRATMKVESSRLTRPEWMKNESWMGRVELHNLFSILNKFSIIQALIIIMSKLKGLSILLFDLNFRTSTRNY